MCDQSESGFFSAERQRMVARQLRSRGIRDERVLEAMGKVPRHEFVPAAFRMQAYGDHPLPIAKEQTISQPLIVALMLELAKVEATQKVLEVGTGSGYMTALLAELAARVYSVERHPALAQWAEKTLSRLGYRNVTVLVGDGILGWPEQAPYDAIVVSAAAPQVPEALFEQLGEGGRLLIPIGSSEAQRLQLVQKQDGGRNISELEGCRFVPLIPGVSTEPV